MIPDEVFQQRRQNSCSAAWQGMCTSQWCTPSNHETKWSRLTVSIFTQGWAQVGNGHQLLLCFEEMGPAGAAARYPLLRGACARAGGATKECTGVVRGATAYRQVRISGHISHGVANGTIMPKKKCALPEKPGCAQDGIIVVTKMCTSTKF